MSLSDKIYEGDNGWKAIEVSNIKEVVNELKEKFTRLTFCNECKSSLSICKCKNDKIRKVMWTHAVIMELDQVFGEKLI